MLVLTGFKITSFVVVHKITWRLSVIFQLYLKFYGMAVIFLFLLIYGLVENSAFKSSKE